MTFHLLSWAFVPAVPLGPAPSVRVRLRRPGRLLRPARAASAAGRRGARRGTPVLSCPAEAGRERGDGGALGAGAGTVSVRVLGWETEVAGRWMLYVVPALWASFVVVVRLLWRWGGAGAALSPLAFNALRLVISAVVALPLLARECRSAGARAARGAQRPFGFVWAGVELGLWIFLANLAQLWGLRSTTASRAAFLNQLQTVIVPMVAVAVGAERLGMRTIMASGLAVGGVGMITMDGVRTMPDREVLCGDILEVVCAVLLSINVIRLGHHARRIPIGPLVAMKIFAQTCFAILLLVLKHGFQYVTRAFSTTAGAVPAAAAALTTESVKWTLTSVVANAAVVVWAGVGVSALSTWLQTKGQAAVPASEAAVIYASLPLWTAVLAAAVLGETFGLKGILGALLIIGASVYSATGKPEMVMKEE